uniref:hypothetical protein n=1 Tax=Gracilaria urvillei TaxID=172974 RepID=UPI001D124109|nr:hypothetical protein LK147_pgp117 [Hydropuntia urvillei]UAD88423.1 hypothetical protein [Hydropuntia urvillei]
MNIFICTAFILSQPKLKKVKNQNFCYMLLSLNNHHNKLSNIRVRAFARSKVAKKIFDLYKEKNKVIIESSIYTKKLLLGNYKKKSEIYIKIHKINDI